MKTFILLLFLSITSTYPQIYMRGVAPIKPSNLWKYNDLGWLNFQINFFVTDSLLTINDKVYNVVEEYTDENPTRYLNFYNKNSIGYLARYDTLSIDSTYEYYLENANLGAQWSSTILNFKYHYTVQDTFTIPIFDTIFFVSRYI